MLLNDSSTLDALLCNLALALVEEEALVRAVGNEEEDEDGAEKGWLSSACSSINSPPTRQQRPNAKESTTT